MTTKRCLYSVFPIKSFNGRLRDECLNQHIFESLGDAREKINEWMEDYNTVRPHGALGWLATAAYREKNLNSQEINLKFVWQMGCDQTHYIGFKQAGMVRLGRVAPNFSALSPQKGLLQFQ